VIALSGSGRTGRRKRIDRFRNVEEGSEKKIGVKATQAVSERNNGRGPRWKRNCNRETIPGELGRRRGKSVSGVEPSWEKVDGPG